MRNAGMAIINTRLFATLMDRSDACRNSQSESRMISSHSGNIILSDHPGLKLFSPSQGIESAINPRNSIAAEKFTIDSTLGEELVVGFPIMPVAVSKSEKLGG